jgi:hypothetical protein
LPQPSTPRASQPSANETLDQRQCSPARAALDRKAKEPIALAIAALRAFDERASVREAAVAAWTKAASVAPAPREGTTRAAVYGCD